MLPQERVPKYLDVAGCAHTRTHTHTHAYTRSQMHTCGPMKGLLRAQWAHPLDPQRPYCNFACSDVVCVRACVHVCACVLCVCSVCMCGVCVCVCVVCVHVVCMLCVCMCVCAQRQLPIASRQPEITKKSTKIFYVIFCPKINFIAM